MAKLVYSPRALSDIGRFFDFLAGQDPKASSVNFEYFNSRIGSLAQFPLMGRDRQWWRLRDSSPGPAD
jgi:plasmid stabilization system protein ParE